MAFEVEVKGEKLSGPDPAGQEELVVVPANSMNVNVSFNFLLDDNVHPNFLQS